MSSAEGANQQAYAASSAEVQNGRRQGTKEEEQRFPSQWQIACDARRRAAQSPSESQYEEKRDTGSL